MLEGIFYTDTILTLLQMLILIPILVLRLILKLGLTLILILIQILLLVLILIRTTVAKELLTDNTLKGPFGRVREERYCFAVHLLERLAPRLGKVVPAYS